MWITVRDKEREHVINFNNVIGFTRTHNCKYYPCIELFITQGGITLCYNSEEERDASYTDLKAIILIQYDIGK